MIPIVVDLTVDVSSLEYELSVESNAVAVDLVADSSIVTNPNYDGPYTITPTTSQQTLSTNGKKCVQDIIIEAIPSNYGLITWNGSTLMVS